MSVAKEQDQIGAVGLEQLLYGALEPLCDEEPCPCDDASVSLAEKVYRHVVAGIRTGELSPNARLTQRGLSDQLQVSQVTVREAFERLEQHGWIQREPNRGACVRAFSDRDREEIYYIREMIEAEAVRTLARTVTAEQLAQLRGVLEVLSAACEKNNVELYNEADVQFHRLLVHFVGNKRLQDYYETLVRQIRCFLMVGALKVAFHWAESCEILEPCSHEKIVETLADGDADLAERLIRKHISFGNEVIQMTRRMRET